jgi:hypothetical protein
LVVPIIIAVVVTTTSGPLFGAWGWAESALILLLGEVVVLLALGMYRGEHNPYRTMVPSASHWASHTNDPLVIYAGTLRPPIAADARQSGNNHPILLAFAPAIGALAMLAIVIMGSSDDAVTDASQPAALPIVAVEDNVSLMLEAVDLKSERMTLTFLINDLQWASARTGYEMPQTDDLALDGTQHAQPSVVLATFTPIKRAVKPGKDSTIAWRLRLDLAPPADPSQPVTVTLHTLRFVPNPDLPDLPENVDGEWTFTFIPAAS